MATTFNSNKINTTTSLLFAESTTYNYTKNSKEKTFSSNIRAKYTGYSGIEGTMPLYQIYYNSGNHLWGLWRCPYIRNSWEKPKWYSTFEAAKNKANQFYLEEDIMEEEVEVATSSHITYSKRGKTKYEYTIIQEETFFH